MNFVRCYLSFGTNTRLQNRAIAITLGLLDGEGDLTSGLDKRFSLFTDELLERRKMPRTSSSSSPSAKMSIGPRSISMSTSISSPGIVARPLAKAEWEGMQVLLALERIDRYSM